MQKKSKVKFNFKFAKVFGVIIGAILIIGLSFGYFWQKYDSKNTNETSPLDLSNDGTPLTFMIAGDAMLGRAVAAQFHNDVTQAFTNLGENFFGKSDVGIINLEGPISATEFTANPNPDNLIFNFPPQSIDALKYLGVKAVSLGNNHSQNQGISGLENTRQMLSKATIIPIGSQTSFDENNIKTFENKSYKISIITINTLENHADLSDSIKAEKVKGNIVLIFPHWGSEYQNDTHSSSQESLAHSWIDAGADLIIGSHPHVIQDAEIYKNKPIFYSMGNLVFDQPFSVETQRGLILSGELTSNSTKITIMPTKIVKNQVELLTGEEKDIIINKLKESIGSQNFQGDNILEINN